MIGNNQQLEKGITFFFMKKNFTLTLVNIERLSLLGKKAQKTFSDKKFPLRFKNRFRCLIGKKNLSFAIK